MTHKHAIETEEHWSETRGQTQSRQIRPNFQYLFIRTKNIEIEIDLKKKIIRSTDQFCFLFSFLHRQEESLSLAHAISCSGLFGLVRAGARSD